jgi:hypothetical protein
MKPSSIYSSGPAIGLRAIHAALSSEAAYLCTPSKLEYDPIFELCPHSITTPVLQLVLIECDEINLHEVVRLMYTDTFREKTPVSAASENIEYGLSTGMLTLLGRSRTSFRFHLIDQIVCKTSPHTMRAVDHPIKADLNVAHDTLIQFLLPVDAGQCPAIVMDVFKEADLVRTDLNPDREILSKKHRHPVIDISMSIELAAVEVCIEGK